MPSVHSPQYTAALRIAQRLRADGHQAFFAGGCVRDLLLGYQPKDFDVATSARPELVEAAFPRTESVGAHFGVVLVIESQRSTSTGETERLATEVATFRHDGAYTDGRRPDAVRYSSSPEEDVQRRDFTINGLLLDPLKFEAGEPLEACVLDFVGGCADLYAGVLRAIGDPTRRFAEDKLRALRAVRFAARLGFAIEPATLAAIRAIAHEIPIQVSPERVREEFTRILTEGHARRGFELLDETGLLAVLLPEVERMKGCEQPPAYHPEGDVWVHTLMLLDHLRAEANATLAWGMLLHDVGKPPTYTPPDPSKPGDRIRFNGHAEIGVAVARSILNRLRFSNEDAEQILALVKHHMQFGDVKKMRASTLKRFLRLPRFDEHLALHFADVSSSHGMLGMYDFVRAKREEFGHAEIQPRPLLTGADLIRAGYKPGPRFREMLTVAEDAQLEGAVTTPEAALAMVRAQFGDDEPEVLILGAGMAGLAAARALAERGQRVLVLEARDRVGGRVRTHLTANGNVVELGAEFIHGRAPELWALVEETGLPTTERTGLKLREKTRGGGLEEDRDSEEGNLFSGLEDLAGFEQDMPFGEWLRGSNVPERHRAALVGYVEGFNAADAERISARSLGLQQRAEEASGGDRAWHVQAGYAELARHLALRVNELKGEVRLQSEVVALRWQPGRVEAELRSGERVAARRCIVTLPLGVLQQPHAEGGLLLQPEPRALAAAQQLAMGTALHFTLVFREAWWLNSAAADTDTLGEMSFLFTPERSIPVWWTAHPEPEAAPTLTGWVGGPKASALAARIAQNPAEQLGQLACAELASIFSTPEEQLRAALLSVNVRDWSADPLARGAYSYVPANALEAPAAMAQPEADTLFFAGEHTDTSGHWGTVHAALRTGLRAAAQVLGET